MTDWIDIRNFDALMSDYQKNSHDSTKMPGLGTYFKKIIDQNNQIIILLEKLNSSVKK